MVIGGACCLAFVGLAIVAGIVIGYIRKGNLLNLAQFRLKWFWILPASYIFQFLSIHVLADSLYGICIVLSYLGLLLFCYLNFSVRGIALAGMGIFLNFLEMSLNDLRMPAYVPAVRAVSPKMVAILEAGHYYKSSAMTGHTVLPFLGDIIPVKLYPETIASIGDFMFAIGIVLLITQAMTSMNEVNDDYAEY